jgi:prephenate dehydratase
VKTSIAFALVDTPGVLFKALSVFALRDIHLVRTTTVTPL